MNDCFLVMEIGKASCYIVSKLPNFIFTHFAYPACCRTLLTIRHNKERHSFMNIVSKWFENVAMCKIYDEIETFTEFLHILNVVVNLQGKIDLCL